MTNPAPTPTIDDVARHARVSKATVSRVINGNYGVSEELRLRVMEAIRTLGYQPDRSARRLRGTASELLGIIIPDIQNPYFTSVVRGIEDLAYEHKMNVLLCNTDDDPVKQETYIRVMMAERVAGLILAPSFGIAGESLGQLARLGTPVVLIDRSVPTLPFDTVTVDNFHGAYEGTRHLIRQGYRRIAFVGGDLELSPGRERLAGYQRAIADHDLPVEPDLTQLDHFKIESGQRLTHRLLSLPEPPEAIFSASNLLSIGVLKAVREAGLRIPDDIAVVGFDDMPWASELYSPLTAIVQPTYELGQEAVRALLRRRDEPNTPIHTVTLRTSLVIRESCGALRHKGGDPGEISSLAAGSEQSILPETNTL